MADTKIASLTDGTSTSATDRIPVAISPYGSGNNAYITPAYLKTFMVTGGTVTTSAPVFDMTQTWNAGAQTFTGLKLNVTDTASAAGSLLLDLQVGGGSVFSVTKDGQTSCLISNKTGTSGTGEVSIWDNSSFSNRKAGLINSFGGFSNGVGLASDNVLLWDSGTNLGAGTQDLVVRRDAANTLALQNGTSAQTLNVYNTWSSAGANYERFTVKWSSNFCYIGTEADGTGTLRTIVFGANPTAGAGSAAVQIWGNSVLIGTGSSGANSWTFNSSGHVLASTDNAYDIGASGANRPRAIYCAGTISSSGVSIGSHVAIPAANFVSWGSRGAIKSPADKVITLTDNAGTGPAIANTGQFTVADLPSAASYAGSMAFVSDANATTPRSTVAGGGSNKVMVMSDGSNWLIVA